MKRLLALFLAMAFCAAAIPANAGEIFKDVTIAGPEGGPFMAGGREWQPILAKKVEWLGDGWFQTASPDGGTWLVPAGFTFTKKSGERIVATFGKNGLGQEAWLVGIEPAGTPAFDFWKK